MGDEYAEGDIVCCTAWKEAGHYTWLPGMRSYERERLTEGVGPWKGLDTKTLHPARQGSDPTGEAWLTWEDGWTALGIEDRTVDSRPNSHATFAIRGEHMFTEALDIARQHFPEVIARIEKRAPIRHVPGAPKAVWASNRASGTARGSES